ncbi:MAG: hypothetical protein HYY42_02020, partial [Chloroflexi bacterium]|nr:hypothetical protein [Chloroflexota bacterium]
MVLLDVAPHRVGHKVPQGPPTGGTRPELAGADVHERRVEHDRCPVVLLRAGAAGDDQCREPPHALRVAPARQVARGECAAASQARYEAEYLLAHRLLGAAGYAFYEVSNAARPGHQAVHNSAYWRRAAYLGFGPSAHSFDGACRWWNEPAYARWRSALTLGRSPVAGREILSEPQRRL